MDAVTYVHLILDHHAVIIAEGIPCESLLLASQSLAMMERETLLKLGSVLAPDRLYQMKPARKIVTGKRLKRLLARHDANAQPLCIRPSENIHKAA
jgi:hypothetical protein